MDKHTCVFKNRCNMDTKYAALSEDLREAGMVHKKHRVWKRVRVRTQEQIG